MANEDRALDHDDCVTDMGVCLLRSAAVYLEGHFNAIDQRLDAIESKVGVLNEAD